MSDDDIITEVHKTYWLCRRLKMSVSTMCRLPDGSMISARFAIIPADKVREIEFRELEYRDDLDDMPL